MELVVLGLALVAVLLVVVLVVMGRKTTQAPSRGALTAHASSPAASVNLRSNWLEGLEGQVKGKTYHVGAREVTMGRKVGNYIQLLDDNVSRVHLKLRGHAAGVEVTDQGGKGGTLVNGTPIGAKIPHLLNHGDRLQLGENVFLFHAQGHFGTNHGLTERKIAGDLQSKKTKALVGLDMSLEVTRALAQSGGDMDKAAAQMGVSREIFEKMVEQLGG